jgi:CDP-paratose 2-epimerase
VNRLGTILITGGCGFVGSNLAIALRKKSFVVTCFDNLSRRGSELLLKRIQEYGCRFVYGDIRNDEDFNKISGDFDVMIECSAEPSVLVGSNGNDAFFMVNNNLVGSIKCFEFCRKNHLPIIFLSTSRIYPYDSINSLKFEEGDSRFIYADRKNGVSEKGIAVGFDLRGIRSLYGATKLSSEYILNEYSNIYNLPCIINRCGVIAGPWQLGKVDQGVFTYWMANHYFKKPLKYIGFGGAGKQVRDLLHIDDLIELILKQIEKIKEFRGTIFNAGGSSFSNLSLVETTRICSELSGNKIEILSSGETRPADVKWFVTDNGRTESQFNWHPTRNPQTIMTDIYNWIVQNENQFKSIMGR